MLWVATAIGGVGGVLVVQAIKRLIDKVLPEPIGRKAMYYISWVVSFGFGIVAYVLFPEGRALISRQPFAIFQAGSTVSALAAAIYRLIAERLGLSRSAVNTTPAPTPNTP
jgi:predicted lysophospholipase L1 biosynthesis ABC-type transport system permease subunit